MKKTLFVTLTEKGCHFLESVRNGYTFIVMLNNRGNYLTTIFFPPTM